MIRNIFTFALGTIAIVLGLAIYGWIIYNMFFPTESFKRSAGFGAGHYVFPALMIIFGVKWLRSAFGPRGGADSDAPD